IRACTNEKYDEFYKLLGEFGNISDSTGLTPLKIAITNNNKAIVQKVLTNYKFNKKNIV
ncbi:MAG: hypothetical protein Edafosvirus3_1, partial [Edafosvirus sp.]